MGILKNGFINLVFASFALQLNQIIQLKLSRFIMQDNYVAIWDAVKALDYSNVEILFTMTNYEGN